MPGEDVRTLLNVNQRGAINLLAKFKDRLVDGLAPGTQIQMLMTLA